MLIQTKGIVFRNIKYGETSIIVDIYTQALGLRSYIINGVRKPRARLSANLFQIGSLVEMVAYDKHFDGLNRVKEAKAAYLYQTIHHSIAKNAIIQFIIEITRKSIREKEENPPLFDFIYHTFIQLDQASEKIGDFHIHYMLDLSGYLGFRIEACQETYPYFLDIREGTFSSHYQDHKYQLNEDQSLWINQLISNQSIVLKGSERKHLIDGLILYYKYHIEGFGEVNAHTILSDILH